MKWESLLETVADKPVFSVAQLLSENEPARQVRLHAKFAPNTAAKALRETIESARKTALVQPVAQEGKNDVAA